MLVRHISIPRNTHLLKLQQPTQKQIIQQSVDYSNHLNRTLNPQRPADQTLVDHFSPQKQHPKKQYPKQLFQTFSKPQFLMKQYPLTMQEFTDAPLSPQQTQQPKSKAESQPKTVNRYRIKQNWSTLAPHLSNNPYIKSPNLLEGRDVSFVEKVKNKPYIQRKKQRQFKEVGHLLLPKDGQQEIDEGIVNYHSKIHSKRGQLYRTISKFRDKNLLQDHQQPHIRQRKYNLSLPKATHKRQWHSNLLPNQEAPLSMRKTTKQNGLQPIDKQNSELLPQTNKRRIMPAQEQEQEHKQLKFDEKKKQKAKRKTSQQQNTIIAKPQYETLNTNKIKKRNSAIELERRSSNKDINLLPPKIQISYRMSFSQLRQVCSMKNLQSQNVVIKIPEIFAYPLFTGKEEQEELFSKASQLIKHLQIRSSQDISIKKYTNCILVVAGTLAVIWHYSGKVYFGGWQYHIFDEGTKTGLGLEWFPKKYVYYGQFLKNKREGVGIMKDSSNQILSGVWRQNKYLRSMGINVSLQAAKGDEDY